MAEDLESGTRVKIVLEGETSDTWRVYGQGYYDTGSLIVDDGKGEVYLESIPATAIEVIPKPLEPGLYYYADAGKGQMTGVYKLDATDGKWYNNYLEEVVQMQDYILDNLVPLVQGKR